MGGASAGEKLIVKSEKIGREIREAEDRGGEFCRACDKIVSLYGRGVVTLYGYVC